MKARFFFFLLFRVVKDIVIIETKYIIYILIYTALTSTTDRVSRTWKISHSRFFSLFYKGIIMVNTRNEVC